MPNHIPKLKGFVNIVSLLSSIIIKALEVFHSLCLNFIIFTIFLHSEQHGLERQTKILKVLDFEYIALLKIVVLRGLHDIVKNDVVK